MVNYNAIVIFIYLLCGIILSMKLENIRDIPTIELAEFLGVHKSFISNIKHGRRKLPAIDCGRVSKKFNISKNALRPDIFY